MRVHWISDETYQQVMQAWYDAAPRYWEVLKMHIQWRRHVELNAGASKREGYEPIDLDGFMTFLGMLAAPRPWIEVGDQRAFALPVEEVNRIGRMILGAEWAGIGALTLCDPSSDGGLTLAAAGELEVYDGV